MKDGDACRDGADGVRADVAAADPFSAAAAASGVKGVARQVILFLVPAVLLGALLVGAVLNWRRAALPPSVGPREGLLAPPLVAVAATGGREARLPLTDQEGRPVRLEDHRGKVVVLNFWASWCVPCRKEMPDLQRLEAKYRGRVKVIAVNATNQDDEGATRLFLSRYGIELLVAFDRTGQVTAAYGVYFFPTTFIVDPAGVIRARVEGRMTLAMMEAALRAGLGGRREG